MSGGVDSSFVAAKLQADGHDVIGITMLVVPSTEDTASAVADKAKLVARKLGIPHHTVDLREQFSATIIDDFCRQYAGGRTPNPCVNCNCLIKFGSLMDEARRLGASRLATGHYARVFYENDRYILKKGIDQSRDQSYFLYRLTPAQLAMAIFPVGDMIKDNVKFQVKAMELPVAATESREICFIPENDYRGFLARQGRVTSVAGDIVDVQGHRLGQHQGISSYTIGQRHGLGIAGAEPRYVIELDAVQNRVIMGNKADLFTQKFTAGVVNWVSIPDPEDQFTASVKIRYRHPGAEAVITPLPGKRVHVEFTEPQPAVTPGQAAVFYDGDKVLGGGTIEYGKDG